jgi:hypothetical protein
VYESHAPADGSLPVQAFRPWQELHPLEPETNRKRTGNEPETGTGPVVDKQGSFCMLI